MSIPEADSSRKEGKEGQFMGKTDKLLNRILEEDKNLRFRELRSVLEKLGYRNR